MLNNKGSSLIESLFAFQIYVSVIIICISLLSSLYLQQKRLNDYYHDLQREEEILSNQEEFAEIVKMVLH